MKTTLGKIILSLAVAIVCLNCAVAQNSHEIKLKGTFPIGDFDRVGETAEMAENGLIGSGAAEGAGLGYRYNFDLANGIAFFVGGDIYWNMTNARYREICKNPHPKDENEPQNQTPPQYFNFPLWVGVSYRTPFGNSNYWSAYFGVGAGLNVHYTTSTGWKNFEVRYNPVFSAALTIDAGITFRQFSLGGELVSLGSPTIKGSGEETHHKFKTLDKQRKMLMFNVVFSYKLSKHKKEWKPTRKTILDM